MIELILQTEHSRLPETLLDRLRHQIQKLSAATRSDPDVEATIVLVSDKEIAELNAMWRGVDGPTDVLSFPMQEGDFAELTPLLLGDIVVSVDTAARQVEAGAHRARLAERGITLDTWTLEDELLFLIVHGFLHLLGHDHAAPSEEEAMRAEEERVFSALIEDADRK